VPELPSQGSLVGNRKIVRSSHRQEDDIELLALEGVDRADPDPLLEVSVQPPRLSPCVGDAERPVLELFRNAELLQLGEDSVDLARVERNHPEAQVRPGRGQILELLRDPACLGGSALALSALLLSGR